MADIIFEISRPSRFEEVKDITVAMSVEREWTIPAGVRIMGGRPVDDDILTVQSWHFDTERWDLKAAKKWMNMNYHYYYRVMSTSGPAANEGLVINVIKKKGGKWYVLSETGKNLGGPYDTKAEAEKRLKQVEFFKRNTFQSLTANFSGKVRHDTMEGRPYLVAPMIMAVVGILNGSEGPLYYPEEELSKTPAVWNYKPIVVYHPQINGKGVSACDPDIISNRKVGVIMKTKFEDNKLKAEAWLEEDRLKIVDNRILDALETGKVMELSTGVFTDNEVGEGEYNGKTYWATARNYRPDHLALLPDQVGACSVEDGAGLLRLNEEASSGTGLLAKAARAFLDVMNEGDETKDNDGATNEPKKGEGDGIGTDDGDGDLKSNQKGDKGMDKKAIVDSLIKNSGWAEEDREFLMGLDEAQLKKIVPPKTNQEEIDKLTRRKRKPKRRLRLRLPRMSRTRKAERESPRRR
jgi:hypothetical protein